MRKAIYKIELFREPTMKKPFLVILEDTKEKAFVEMQEVLKVYSRNKMKVFTSFVGYTA